MVNKDNTSFIKTSFLNDLYEDVEIHYPAKNDRQGEIKSQFDFAFQFEADGVDYLSDDTAFQLSVNSVEQEWITDNGVRKPSRKYTEIEYEL